MNILHLSFEYPDAISPHTTQAVKNLIGCAESFARNHCFSFHGFWLRRSSTSYSSPDHTVLGVRGLPLPYTLKSFLARCTETALAATAPWPSVDLIHGHKLTMEGVIACELSRALNVPFCVSLRATDFALLEKAPHLRTTWAAVLHSAKKVAAISPWMIETLKRKLGELWDESFNGKFVLLGNVVDGALQYSTSHNGRYAMAFKINRSQLHRKGVRVLLEALARLKQEGLSIPLDLIGSGSGTAAVGRWIRRYGLDDQVRLTGPCAHADMIGRLSGYKALIMCSRPETFGLVYIEALRAGIPIIYSRGCGIDGFFPDGAVGVAAEPGNADSIKAAIKSMEKDYATYKQQILRLQRAQELSFFQSSAFTERLRNELYCQ